MIFTKARINAFIVLSAILLTSLFSLILYCTPVAGQDSSLSTLDTSEAFEIQSPFAICHGHGHSTEAATNLSNIGVQLTRNDIYWGQVQYHEGDPAFFDYSGYDVFYNNIVAVGIEPLAILDYGNPYLLGAENHNIIAGEAHIALWLDFVDETVRRYMDRITYWEIWNEPNLDGFWSGTDEEFFYLFNITMRFIKGINPDLKVLSPGISGHDPDYLDRMISYVGDEAFNEFIDILAFHPYSGSAAQDVKYKSQLVWEVVREHNFNGEVWITEVGRSTQVSSEEDLWQLPYNFQIQSRELIKAFATALGENISRIVWYCYSDSWNIDITYGEACFGIIYRPNDTAVSWEYKPSGYLYRKLSAMLTNTSYLPHAIQKQGFTLQSSENDFSYYFKTQKNTSVVILWTQNTPYYVQLQGLGIKNVSVHSLFDDSNYTITPDKLSFELNSYPLLLEINWESGIEPRNILCIMIPSWVQFFAFIIGPIVFLIGVIFVVSTQLKRRV